jgi:hypothetical protein
MTKTIALFSAFFLSICPVSAATLTIIGEVPAINEIIVENMGLDTGILGADLTPNQEIPMVKFTLHNNDPDGFYVNFSSENQGHLVSFENETDQIPYTISTKATTSSGVTHIGTAEPLPIDTTSLQQDAQMVFNSNVTQATRGRAYVLYIAAAEPISQSTAYYGDNLTITIHNL